LRAHGLPVLAIAVGVPANLLVWSDQMSLTHMIRKANFTPLG